MILGTVQLGMPYGVSNKAGMPSDVECEDILSLAEKSGVRLLDTASGYGESEARIGRYLARCPSAFRVCTKLPVRLSVGDVREAVLASARRLNVESIDLCYLHRFEQFEDAGIMSGLERARDEGLVRRVGVSVYEPAELEEITASAWGVDAVQIPLNVFTLASWRAAMDAAARRGITLYARSVYLQGLVFVDPDGERAKAIGASPYLAELRAFSEGMECSVASLCLAAVLAHPQVEDILLGCETVGQLQGNLKLLAGLPELGGLDLEDLAGLFEEVPREVTNPSFWPKW